MKAQKQIRKKENKEDSDSLEPIDISSIDKNEISEGDLTEEQEIYRENILDHYRHPHNVGKIELPTFCKEEFNPLCGDRIELFVQLDKKNNVVDVKYIGRGCAISQASMSLLSDTLKGKNIEELKKMTREDILDLLKIPVGVVRLKCAMLSLKTLQEGIAEYEDTK